MKNKIVSIAASMLSTFLLGGCCSTGNVAKPGSITLVNAMHDIGAGLAELKAAELEMVATNQYLHARIGTNDFITGIFPSEVDVTFNVTASAEQNNQLSIDLSAAVPNVPVSGKVSDTFSSQSAASRGNQITLKFMSALFTTTTTTTTSTNGTKVAVEQKITDPATLVNFWKAIGSSSGSVIRTLRSDAVSSNDISGGDGGGGGGSSPIRYLNEPEKKNGP